MICRQQSGPQLGSLESEQNRQAWCYQDQFMHKAEHELRKNSNLTYLNRRYARQTESKRRRIQQNNIQKSSPIMFVCASTMIIIMLANCFPVAESVDCFKCSSRNGSNPACEDPFHNLNTTRITSHALPDNPPNVMYHTPCYAGKKGRDGLFLASACIKLTGTFDTTGETLIVRHCALDSGTLTQDTELARMSHCGKFQFEGDLLKGCVLACPEDACNSAPSATQILKEMPSIIFIIVLAMVFVYHHQLT